ncbi:DUF5994 family protein [Streptomyces aurantiogriseus]
MEAHGCFDGAWWPRSRDLESQLPGLLTALTARPGVPGLSPT